MTFDAAASECHRAAARICQAGLTSSCRGPRANGSFCAMTTVCNAVRPTDAVPATRLAAAREPCAELDARHIDGTYVPVSKIPAQQLRRLHPAFSWTTRMDLATGRLCLRAFCPHPNAEWTGSWREREILPHNQLDEIVQQIIGALGGGG